MATIVQEILQRTRRCQAPGDLIFIRGTEGIASTIKRLTKSPYTHMAGFVLPNQLIESQALRKTGFENVKTYEGVADIYVCDTLSHDQRMAIVRHVVNEIGTGYDYLLIGKLGLQLLLGLSGVRHHRAGKQICSTLWASAYRAANIDLTPGNLCPTPADLARSPLLRFVGSF